jgi:MGT family glycosyltransferase
MTQRNSQRPLTFLMTSASAKGHLLRVLDLAQQLSARGHRVLFKAKYGVAAEVKAASAELIPYENQIDFQDFADLLQAAELPLWMPKVPYAIAQFRTMLQSRSVLLAQEIEPILRREQVDCVVYDFFEVGAAWAAERAGIPYASAGNMGTVLTKDEVPLMFNTVPLLRPFRKVPALMHAVANQFISFRASRAKLGLPPYAGRTADMVHGMTSPMLHIVMAHRGFAGDIPLRDNQLFVGPTTFNVSSKPRENALHVEPGTVVVSTTTTGKDDGWFRRVLEALAPMNVPVLATAAGVDDIPPGLPSHIRVERYIPHDTVFPQARALITHGGWGTVGRALVHGLPMLTIPIFGDQTLNAELVERAGHGRRLPLNKATPDAIRAELRALLEDDAVLARARRASAEIKKLKEEQVAACALEKLASRPKTGAAASSRSAA